MRDWSVSLLKSLRDEKLVSEEGWNDELQHPPFVWRRIADLFLHRFDSDAMTELLGSTLCDIPRTDFDKIFAENPFFILVKSAGFRQKLHRALGDIIVVVFVVSELAGMNWEQRRATIAHELAHIVRHDLNKSFSLNDPWRRKQEEEADDLCRQWGFDIDSLRSYLETQ